MLKQLSVTLTGMVLGFAVLTTSTAPAMADRDKARWIEPAPSYTYDVKPQKRAATKSQQQQREFQDSLDFSTEAVWRNLRPNRFDN